MVPVERIELPTFGLQNRCSTAELNRLAFERLFMVVFSASSTARRGLHWRSHPGNRNEFEEREGDALALPRILP